MCCHVDGVLVKWIPILRISLTIWLWKTLYRALYFTVARSAEGRPPAGLTVRVSARLDVRPLLARVRVCSLRLNCDCFCYNATKWVYFCTPHIMYDSYVRTESCREVTRLFRDRFPDIRASRRDTVRKLINRFRETGSVLDKKPQRTRHMLTEENLDAIRQTLERSPRKSLSRLSQETDVSQFSDCKFAR